MDLTINREVGDVTCVPGELLLGGVHECWTLERLRLDPQAEHKYGHLCCIPPGRYEVKMLWSAHFGAKIPHVLDVPDRVDIEIHSGNWVKDSLGCPLVGHKKGKDMLLESAVESKELNDKITAVLATGDRCWLTVNEPEGV